MKTMHKILLLVAILLLMASPALAANGNTPSNVEAVDVSIMLDGQVMNTKPASFIDGDYTLVPIRFVSESLGADVGWDAKTRKVTVVQGGNTITMNIDSRVVYINSSKKTLEAGVTPKLVNNRTMVPLRFLSETFGYDVGFDKEKTMPTIVTKKEPAKTPAPEPVQASRPTSVVHKIVEANGSISIDKSGDMEIRQMRLENPKRIVFDLLDTSVSKAYEEFDFNINELRKMRVSQFDSDMYGKDRKVVRVVLDLNESYQDPDVKLETGKNILNLSLNSKGPIKVQAPVEEKPAVTQKPTEDKKPSGNNAQVLPLKPTKTDKKRIVIDPGHGGHDPGAVQNGVREKDVVLSISQKLNRALANDYISILTRDDDRFLSLGSRPQVAKDKDADMFLSIHANSAGSASASGVEVWYNSTDKKYSKGTESKNLATTLSKNIADKTGANNRGAKISNGFAVLKPTEVPSALIEVGFLSNAKEAKNLTEDAYQNKIVQAIVDSINKFFN